MGELPAVDWLHIVNGCGVRGVTEHSTPCQGLFLANNPPVLSTEGWDKGRAKVPREEHEQTVPCSLPYGICIPGAKDTPGRWNICGLEFKVRASECQ